MASPHRNPDAPATPPEAELIEAARGRRSVRSTAKIAGISESRWRQIAKGYQPVQAGLTIPVVAPATTLATMADAVGVTPEQLQRAGRDDAAEELITLRKQEARTRAQRSEAIHDRAQSLHRYSNAELISELTRRLDAATPDTQDDYELAARHENPRNHSVFHPD